MVVVISQHVKNGWSVNWFAIWRTSDL